MWRFSVAEERPAALEGFYELLADVRGEHPGFVGERGREALEAHPGFGPFRHHRVPFLRRTSRSGLIAEAASASFVNALEHREQFLERLCRALASVEAVDVPYAADVWVTTRRPD